MRDHVKTRFFKYEKFYCQVFHNLAWFYRKIFLSTTFSASLFLLEKKRLNALYGTEKFHFFNIRHLFYEIFQVFSTFVGITIWWNKKIIGCISLCDFCQKKKVASFGNVSAAVCWQKCIKMKFFKRFFSFPSWKTSSLVQKKAILFWSILFELQLKKIQNFFSLKKRSFAYNRTFSEKSFFYFCRFLFAFFQKKFQKLIKKSPFTPMGCFQKIKKSFCPNRIGQQSPYPFGDQLTSLSSWQEILWKSKTKKKNKDTKIYMGMPPFYRTCQL